MTGAMGALQDWDGLWRFAYSHGEDGLRDRKGFPGYFDVASDPLGQASDRASVCLFLRGDMAPLADKLALTVTPDTFMPADGKPTGVVPKWRDAAWQTQVGTAVAPVPAGVKTFNLGEQIARTNAPVSLAVNPAIAFDRTAGSFGINTPRTAGGFAEGGPIDAGGLRAVVSGAPATVWATSLDGEPLERSSRILVAHLTDVQPREALYADDERTILLDWGTPQPLVMRRGRADIAISVSVDAGAQPPSFAVFALSADGSRRQAVPASHANGRLSFTVEVERDISSATWLYEVERK
jgi:hypothetical protein